MNVYVSSFDLNYTVLSATGMPDVNAMKFLGSSYSAKLNFPNSAAFATLVPGTPNNNFVATWSGQFVIALSGLYTFCTTSDDGSTLYIDGALVVKNGGVHVSQTRCGNITLFGGLHVVFSNYFQEAGYCSWQVTYSGPDTIYVSTLLQSGANIATTACISCAPGSYLSLSGTSRLLTPY